MKNLATVIKDITEDNQDAWKTGQDNGYNQGRKCKCRGECDCE